MSGGRERELSRGGKRETTFHRTARDSLSVSVAI